MSESKQIEESAGASEVAQSSASAVAGNDPEAPGEDQAQELDEDVFNQDTDLLGVQIEQKFRCINPQTKSGHIVYNCYGADDIGEWEGVRRYKEFHKLHEELLKRWPGVPIPQIPPKKTIGNKDVKFINERRFYLERFLKKMASYPFVLNSQEFKCFSRPQASGDIEKILSKLAPESN